LILLKRQYQTLGNKGSNFSEYILGPKSPIFIYNSVGYRNFRGEHPLNNGHAAVNLCAYEIPCAPHGDMESFIAWLAQGDFFPNMLATAIEPLAQAVSA
jgi:hypothetical protein